MTAWWRLARQKQLSTSVVGGAVRGEFVRVRPGACRCPDCGRTWTVYESEAAFRHLPTCPAPGAVTGRTEGQTTPGVTPAEAVPGAA